MARMKTRYLENGGLRRRARSGFTLLELLIVVLIVGILATLILPRFAGHADRARAAEAINIMGTIRRGLLAYYDEHMHWPDSNDMENLDEIEGTLDLEFTPPRYGWSFNVIVDEVTPCKIRGNKSGGEISLDAESGAWNGTDDYAPTGKYFPYLP